MSGAETQHRSLGMYVSTLVEEHSQDGEAVPIRSRGVLRRENAGMSSEMEGGILQAEYPRFPE